MNKAEYDLIFGNLLETICDINTINEMVAIILSLGSSLYIQDFPG